MITMGPFLEDYKNGKILGLSLDAFISKNPHHELALIIKKIHAVNNNHQYFDDTRVIDDAIFAANQFDYKVYAVEEQLIYLHFLCLLYVISNRINSAKTTLSIIRSLIVDTLPPEWKIIPIDLEGNIYGYEGKFHKKLASFENALQILEPTSGRYKVLIWVYLMHLCLMNEHEKYLTSLEKYQLLIKGTTETRRIDYILMLKNLEIGNLEILPSLIANIREDKTLTFCENDIIICEKIYNMLYLNNFDTLDENNPNEWHLVSFGYLIKKEPEKAIYWAHKFADSNLDYKMMSSFISYFLIRAELANGNTNAAMYSLENKKRIENTCIFDDFFWFRIYHIKGDTEKAQYFFNLFTSNVEKDQLNLRFDLELKLSPEISFTDIRFYSRNLKNPDFKSNPTNKDDDQNKIAKYLNFIVGNSHLITQVKELVLKYASIDTSVLIMGETGTGKELVAKALWQAGPYRDKPFIPINCGAISDHLLQSELFGHQKGAFTGAFQDHKGVFEEAGDGIVFLDEIGEISSVMQISLLRILEAKEFRPVGSNINKKLKCKIITATNRNLNELVKSGLFRSDLQFRLERLTIEIPALRDRSSDIPILIDYFLNKLNPILPEIIFDKPSLTHLSALPWTGNIRELRNEMERIRLFYSDKKILTVAELSEKYRQLKTNNELPKRLTAKQDAQSNALNFKSKFRKLEELKDLFHLHKSLSRIEVADLLNVSANTSANYLNALEQENFIIKTTPANAKTHYFEMVKKDQE